MLEEIQRALHYTLTHRAGVMSPAIRVSGFVEKRLFLSHFGVYFDGVGKGPTFDWAEMPSSTPLRAQKRFKLATIRYNYLIVFPYFSEEYSINFWTTGGLCLMSRVSSLVCARIVQSL